VLEGQVNHIYKEAKQENIIDAEIVDILTDLDAEESQQLTEANEAV
jgi:hypothetical protein